MNRRESIRGLFTATGVLLTLPSWAENWSFETIAGQAPTFGADQIQLINSVADTIIPAGNSIGAISVGVDKFLVKLFDDCYELEARENIKEQLGALEQYAQKAHAQSFVICTQEQREELLTKFSTSAKEEEKKFFTVMKSETIRGFNTSKEVMLQYHKYKVAPGHYYGCVDVKA